MGETTLELNPNNIFDIPTEWEDGAGAFYKCMVNPFSDISTAQEFTLVPKVNIDDGGGDKKKGKKDDKAQELSEEELQKLKDFNAQEEAIWDTLSASEQRYRRAENITKTAKLAKTEPLKANLVGEDIVLIEDLVFENKPLSIFIFR